MATPKWSGGLTRTARPSTLCHSGLYNHPSLAGQAAASQPSPRSGTGTVAADVAASVAAAGRGGRRAGGRAAAAGGGS